MDAPDIGGGLAGHLSDIFREVMEQFGAPIGGGLTVGHIVAGLIVFLVLMTLKSKLGGGGDRLVQVKCNRCGWSAAVAKTTVKCRECGAPLPRR